jgi:hypothetical protein
MRSGRYVWLAGALLAPALILGGVVPGAPVATSGSVVEAGDIVFQDNAGNSPEIQVRDASTGAVTDIAPGREADVSPDGSRIAFIAAGSDGCETLHVMNSDGSAITELVPPDMNSHDARPCSTEDGDPRWSPDGQWIVFNRWIFRSDGTYYEIDKVRADGTGLSTVNYTVQTPTSLVADLDPTWSPTKDGSDGNYRIAFSSNQGDGTYQIYIVDANGHNLHLAGTTTVTPDLPNWSPDGSRIYFTAGDIYYFSSTDNFTSSDASVNLLQSGTNAGGLRLSADGSTLVYHDPLGVYTLSTDGSGAPTLLAGTSGKKYPTFVPATWPNANTKNLVALGDSVAAGEGINYGFIWTGSKWKRTGPSNPSWMDTTRSLGDNYQQCHQSGFGYPNLIALNGGNYKIYNMACTGASALQNNTFTKPEDGGVLDAERFDTNGQPYPQTGYTEFPAAKQDPKKTVPAQLGGSCTGCDGFNKYFGKHNPSVVLLTMGANDLNFAYWLYKCYNPAYGACNKTPDTNLLKSQLAIEKSDLATTLSQLNAWAAGTSPKLRVLVTNYYVPFDPNLTNCVDYNAPIYELGTGISGSELAWLMNGLKHLNANIGADVTSAQASDTHLTVKPVDLSNVMSGHQWCTQHPWVYGMSIDFPVVGDSYLPGHNPAPFHPTPDGQNAIYQAVDAALNSPT